MNIWEAYIPRNVLRRNIWQPCKIWPAQLLRNEPRHVSSKDIMRMCVAARYLHARGAQAHFSCIVCIYVHYTYIHTYALYIVLTTYGYFYVQYICMRYTFFLHFSMLGARLSNNTTPYDTTPYDATHDTTRHDTIRHKGYL